VPHVAPWPTGVDGSVSAVTIRAAILATTTAATAIATVATV